MNRKGEIRIENLRVPTHIGVPDAERAQPQEVAICLTIVPERAMAGLSDSISKTVDYYSVSQRVAAVADEGARRLIETLAEDIADMVLLEFAAESVEVEVRKFILKNADYVSVKLGRQAR